MMFKNLSKLLFLFMTSFAFSQTGHLMQGVGAVNMSMGGASTAQPLDISGAMQWNPAALSTFDGSILKFDIGAFKGTPTLYSTVPDGTGGTISGETESELGYSPMPALAFAWGDADSKHTFGVSAFGVSGFGVDFPENMSNPINNPQPNGFGHVESAYMLAQVGFTWAYQITEKFSVGVQPTFNYQSLELSPNPLVPPTATGYIKSDAETSMGYGGQVGVFYDSQKGIKLGASYKSTQYMSDFEFDSENTNTKFTMNYPAIYSIGLGYSKGMIDFALDFRYVDYAGTDGFESSGWDISADTGFPTGAVKGFGWESMSVVSTGLQLKAIEKLPLRFGYTYSTNPINEELTFYSIPATAIIAHAFQFGFSYEASSQLVFDAVAHYGISDGKTSGAMLNPMAITQDNPLGKIPGTEVAYDMNTHMFMLGVSYRFGGADSDGDGVKDKDDACPNVAGLPEFNGCPDSDNDGVTDEDDACPNEAGLPELNGCPDKDGDGFADKEDLCPDIPGLMQFNGCPDSDGDGVMDSQDECPEVAGLIENKGCPLVDADNDGVADVDDRCPNIAGVAANFGCPEVPEEVVEQIKVLAKSIYFRSGSDKFTNETKIRLESVAKILNEYPNSKFVVEGHTDNTGSVEVNKKLSQKRAEAVLNYLVENSFPKNNIRAIGYGIEKPIGDNKTSKGRQQNRRVEIKLDK